MTTYDPTGDWVQHSDGSWRRIKPVSTAAAPKAAAAPGGGSSAWADITGKPSTFPPTVPIAQADISNLVSDLAGKSATGHTHTPNGGAVLYGTGTPTGGNDGDWWVRTTVSAFGWTLYGPKASGTWPSTYRAIARVTPDIVRDAYNNASYPAQPQAPGWYYNPGNGGKASGVAVANPPFTLRGTASYIVADAYGLSGFTGTSTSGTAYALADPGGMPLSMLSGIVGLNPSEATGKAGLVMASSSSNTGIEVYAKNDNKLYVDVAYFGSRTNVWTSTATFTGGDGAITMVRYGAGACMVIASDWGCFQGVNIPVTLQPGTGSGVFLSNTNTGIMYTVFWSG